MFRAIVHFENDDVITEGYGGNRRHAALNAIMAQQKSVPRESLNAAVDNVHAVMAQKECFDYRSRGVAILIERVAIS